MSEFVKYIETTQGDKKIDFQALGNFPVTQVGQVLRVTAVDDNGYPTTWEAVDMLDPADNQCKTYTALEQIGLTLGSETIEGIATALPNNSRLVIAVSAANATDIYPNGNYGLLVVEKVTLARVVFMFINNLGEISAGVFSRTSAVTVWTDWTHAVALDESGGIKLNPVTTNGYARLAKNHSTENDFGTQLSDYDADGNNVRLVLRASNNTIYFVGTDGVATNVLYGEHNKERMMENINHRMGTYTDLAQIGLTIGSETIADIAASLPGYSRLTLTVGSTNNLEIYPNSNYGLLIVEKTINTHVMFTFINNKAAQWIGVYSIASSGDTWTDWKAVTMDA